MLCCVATMHFSLQQWRIIAGGTKCIPKSELPLEDDDPQAQPAAPPSSRLWLHPSDLSIALSASTPLYLPGRIIHVVHNHPPETWWDNSFEEWVSVLRMFAEDYKRELSHRLSLIACLYKTYIFNIQPMGCITNVLTPLPQIEPIYFFHTCDIK